ncbi:MAG: transketolase, partial [Oscillospiraceae bacterium]|nr:transketolase [Oscillospiraceae bacterium]
QIDGKISEVMSPYPIDEKFRAFGWYVIVIDGHDFDQIEKAFNEASTVANQPVAIIQKTTKGKGVSYMENQVSWHGSAPNEEQYNTAMSELQAKLDELTK